MAPFSYTELAGLYAQGLGVKQNWAEAYFWYSMWEKAGTVDDFLKASDPYIKLRDDASKHLSPDQVAAVDKRVTEWNPPPSADHVKVIEDLQKKAVQGNAVAYFSLGSIADKGFGVKQDYAEAARWYEIGAEKGSPGAQYGLGTLYLNGHGVGQDYTRAYFWLLLSSIDAEEFAFYATTKFRDEAASHLTSDQKSEVEKRVEAWRPDPDVTALKAQAERGDVVSQWALARTYDQGLGEKLKQSYEEAYYWFAIYASRETGVVSYPRRHNSNERAMALRDKAGQNLTSAQKEAADKRVAEWLKTHPAPAITPSRN